MFKGVIPYTPTVLAQVERHQVGTVEKALDIFKRLKLVEVLDNGAIYMRDLHNFIGKSSSEGDRKREYRERIKSEQKHLGQMSEIRPPEIEIEIEKELDKEIEKRYILSCDAGLQPKKTTKKNDNVKLKEQAKDIIDYLNAKLSTNYKPDNKKTLELIKARLKDGFTVENFKTVIDKKFFEWGYDSNMCQYLRPVTLFSTKFESYLNQPTTKYMSKTDRSLLKFLNSDEEGWG